MSEPTTIEALVAFFAPLAVSLVKQAGWPSFVNGAIAIVVYVVFGIGAVIASGQAVDLNNIVPTVALFTTVGTAAYMAFWRNVPAETSLTESTSIVK